MIQSLKYVWCEHFLYFTITVSFIQLCYVISLKEKIYIFRLFLDPIVQAQCIEKMVEKVSKKTQKKIQKISLSKLLHG